MYSKHQTVKRLGLLTAGLVVLYWIYVLEVTSCQDWKSSDYQQTQTERVSKIYTTCSKYKHLLSTPGYKDANKKPMFFASPEYNWSYCKIGKTVSSMWTKFFYILLHDGNEMGDEMTGARNHIHRTSGKDVVYGVRPELFESTRMVVSARNPYSRLFSAYIDRMFIPSLSVSVRGEDDPKCKTDITFSEFLMHVVDNTRQGILEIHWSPVFYMCKPCEIKPEFVFKQETAREDFAHVIKDTKLEPYKLDILQESMSIHSNWSTFALIEDVLDTYAKTNTLHSLDCQTQKEITVQLWEALQIQGVISDKAPFPYKRYKSQDDYDDTDIFREAVLDARKRYPLSSHDKDVQRQNAMNKYYKTVSRNVIDQVLDVYSVDFEMFGYSKNPPPW